MKLDQLATMYSMATIRMHDAVTEAYESMHSNDGDPLESRDHLNIVLTNLKAIVESEADLAITALDERLEDADKQ